MTFAIIRYYIHALGHDAAVWEKVDDPNPEMSPDFLSSQEARKIIKANKMIKVHTYEDGEIWDFPDKRWTKKWKNIFKFRRNEKRLAAKMRAMKEAIKKR